MNNQVKLIDRNKILSDLMRHIDSLNNDMNYAMHEGEESWAAEISNKIELLQLFVDAIMAGAYKPDTVPTIKPGDKVKHKLNWFGIGEVQKIRGRKAYVTFAGYDADDLYDFCELEVVE
ncbi:hypothetical protein [Paenibacillus sp. BR1-192]|uniref:hypothetical protein n=1 Tax=Paenibacillus sp. BR1-192 TaxID=3032287 RepID=UPI00240DC470|nr:hypothetical protein [Paenibacillus sp. BR1-192]WFB57491.1 hypothetical protein P0X86_26535 [Paenibacillus sp. BR1-192]